jgi:hypothetical protein
VAQLAVTVFRANQQHTDARQRLAVVVEHAAANDGRVVEPEAHALDRLAGGDGDREGSRGARLAERGYGNAVTADRQAVERELAARAGRGASAGWAGIHHALTGDGSSLTVENGSANRARLLGG